MKKPITTAEWAALGLKGQQFHQLCNKLANYHNCTEVNKFIAENKEFMQDTSNVAKLNRSLKISQAAKKYHEFLEAFDSLAHDCPDEFLPMHPKSDSNREYEEHERMISEHCVYERTQAHQFSEQYMIL